MQSFWIKGLLIILVAEKVIQHFVVTIAFYFNWRDIGATVALSPSLLMALGFAVGVAFALSLWGILTQRKWATGLVMALALFDIVGEFVAQGKLNIDMTVSFIVASLLLVLALLYRRQLENREISSTRSAPT